MRFQPRRGAGPSRRRRPDRAGERSSWGAAACLGLQLGCCPSLGQGFVAAGEQVRAAATGAASRRGWRTGWRGRNLSAVTRRRRGSSTGRSRRGRRRGAPDQFPSGRRGHRAAVQLPARPEPVPVDCAELRRVAAGEARNRRSSWGGATISRERWRVRENQRGGARRRSPRAV